MGKLRFTLTFVVFWLIIIFSCFLAENFNLFAAEHMEGMSVESLITLSFCIILVLVFYYFREHKKNGLKFDMVLLPIIAIFGLACAATVWCQGDRTFIDPNGGAETIISFTTFDKISITMQIIVWCAVLYGILFAANRYSISRKWLKWLTYAFTAGVLLCTLADVIIEFKDIIAICNNTYTGSGLSFIIYNSNVWANIILVALFCCIVLSLKKFNVFYYILMAHFFIMIVLTSSTTCTFISFAVIIIYTLYDILSQIKTRTRWAARMFFIYLMVLLTVFGLFAMMISLNVPLFVNIWSFLNNHIIKKDYSTLTSRTGIWASVFDLLCEHPQDLIFGLGYRTGNTIFSSYFAKQSGGFFARSAHNGLVEIILRHGLFGASLYIVLLSTFGAGIIKLCKKQQYRVAFMYGICFLGLLAHSITESTMFFAPNIEGTFITIVFFLPVANATKDKYFAELNSDLQSQAIVLNKPNKLDVLQFAFKALVGLLVAFAFSFVTPISSVMKPITVVYIVMTSLIVVSLFVVGAILIKNKRFEFGKDTWLPLASSAGFAVIFIVLFVPRETIATLTFTIFVIFFYMMMFSILYKKENNRLYAFLDEGFVKVLRTVSKEGQNE